MGFLQMLIQKKSILFIVLTLLGSAGVFTYLYFVGFAEPAERGSLWLPKLIIFLVLLITLIIRFKFENGENKKERG